MTTSRSARSVASAAVGSLALAAAVVGVVAASSTTSTAALTAADCAVDGRYLDPAGDVNDLALDPIPITVPVDPALDPDALDVREGFFSTNAAADTVTFHLKVTDLSELAGGLRGLGEEYEIGFTLQGTPYYVTATRSILLGDSFTLGDLGGASGAGRTINGDLSGAFDPDLDMITIDLTRDDLTGASPAQAAFAVGDVIDDVRVVTRRDLLLLAPDADRARSACAYVIDPDPVTTTPTPTTTVTATATATATATETVTGSPTSTATATATQTVTQTATATATATTTEPANRKPKIRKFAAKPLQGQGKARAGTPIRFKAIAKDPDGDKLRYRWNLGDGTKERGRKVFHAYEQEGQYRVFVRIFDGRGGTLKVRAFLRIGPEKK